VCQGVCVCVYVCEYAMPGSLFLIKAKLGQFGLQLKISFMLPSQMRQLTFPSPFSPSISSPFHPLVVCLHCMLKYIYIYLYTFIHIYICNTTRHRPLRVLQLDAVLIAEENPC